MYKYLLGLCLLLPSTASYAQLLTPDDFLPHQLGETFTPHYMLVDYMEHVAANSPNVNLQEYGRTNQQRPLLLAAISTPENLARIEEIRQNNLKRAGLIEGKPDPDLDVAIVWLSFSVHGNEAAGSESSMAVIYELANPQNAKTREWLKNTVVLLDPSLNPDGYSRYTHWYRNVAARIPDPISNVREHREPWPGGRVNHYYFDLNRDWAWQTQAESRQRAIVYNQWMPHVHADLHEQYHNNPYYFAPAARPYHEFITDFQAEFQFDIGKNHAKYFDEEGWLYFTREVFDLLYPSYGDTYPTFNGAIGMTYEQGGHSRAGRSIELTNGDTLTLKDRITHHTTTSLSTVEIASANADKLVEEFGAYFDRSANNPPGKYKTYIIKGNDQSDRLKAFCTILDRNGIRYGKAAKSISVTAYDYQTGENTEVDIHSGDLVISALQPKGIFTQVLMDPVTEIEDSLTYDITAWSLPYAYGLEAYASTEKVNVNPGYSFPAYSNSLSSVSQPYAYLASWKSLQNARFLSGLLKHQLKVRFTSEPFTLEGEAYPQGTLVITRADNRKNASFDHLVKTTAQEFEQEIIAVSTGFADQGSDLGSESMTFIEAPKVAVLSGESTSANEFGQVWYFFEQELHYPIHIFDADQLEELDLEPFNLLILPEGSYPLNDSSLRKLNSWISDGGRLIAIGWAVSSLANKNGFKLTEFATGEDKSQSEKDKEEAMLAGRLHEYAGQGRRWISSSVPGAVFKVNLDTTHPLAFGLSEAYFSLKTNTLTYQHLKDVWNVGTLGEDLMISGFVGSKAKESLKHTTVFAVEDKGDGSVTYLVDNPLFRCFWENGKLLFSNAVFMVGQ